MTCSSFATAKARLDGDQKQTPGDDSRSHTGRLTTTDICYWKGKGEVDFVVSTDQGITPIQVTWDQPKARHEDALEAFYRQFPPCQ